MLPAGAEQASPAQLRELRERIQALQQTQQRDLRRRDQLANELREREIEVSRLARQGEQLRNETRQAEQRLAELREQQLRMAAEQSTQLRWLELTVRTAYMSGREPLMKLLLSQEEPDQVARLLRYHEYFQRARHTRLHELQDELKALLAVSLEVSDARDKLYQRREAVSRQQKELEKARAERATALARLNRRVDEQKGQLSSLREDEARLDKLLQDMNRAISDIPADIGGKPFGDLAGQLPWPVEGRTRVSFGARRDGGMRWNGVLLDASAGTPVQAIHPGRVVYADWLRGYGLIIIVDHGQGYLSLYGHNQSLMRDVGDWVAQGDVLARAGDSGGMNTSGVYFEIRHKGQPVNPDRWCNRRVTLPPVARS
ncbi:peptidoglycan DD-metalloendopeptidase family protein [Alcanivorax sp. JB21]|nr:peptidoglycan DD-metalloendopeptidase family protein [Alcanivorax limicola]